VVPKEHRGEALAAEVLAAMAAAAASATSATSVTPKPRVLLARAEVARDVVPDTLRGAGCEVDVVAVYKTRSPPRVFLEALSSLLEAGEIDAVTFTSSSTVEHLCDALEARAAALLAKTCVASIGPITTETAQKRGVRVDVTAAEYTISGLAEALEKYFTK
jgi:uroporphyrinogen III methyltransferase / synthase